MAMFVYWRVTLIHQSGGGFNPGFFEVDIVVSFITGVYVDGSLAPGLEAKKLVVFGTKKFLGLEGGTLVQVNR